MLLVVLMMVFGAVGVDVFDAGDVVAMVVAVVAGVVVLVVVRR